MDSVQLVNTLFCHEPKCLDRVINTNHVKLMENHQGKWEFKD